MDLMDELQQIADEVHNEVSELTGEELLEWLRDNMQDVTVTTDCYNAPGTIEGYDVYLTGYNYAVRIDTSSQDIEVLEGVSNVAIHGITEELTNKIEQFLESEILN